MLPLTLILILTLTEGATDGGALLCVNELTKIAAERSCGAREAVELMGSLAEAHGRYGGDMREKPYS